MIGNCFFLLQVKCTMSSSVKIIFYWAWLIISVWKIEPKSKETTVNYFMLRHFRLIEEQWEQCVSTENNKTESYGLLFHLLKLPSKPPRVCEPQIARIELCRRPFSFKNSNVKMSPFIVIRRYLYISLLGLLDKKKSNRNLPFAFAVNLVKTDLNFFHALSESYSVGRVFQILRFFSLEVIQVYLLKVFSFLFQLETSVTLSTPASW